jgi:hypothetical protein
MNLKQLAALRKDKPSPQSILVYGEAKTGKTLRVAQELAPHFKLLWLDVENGVQTLMQLPPELQERITYIRIPDTSTNPVGIKSVGLLLSAKRPLPICQEHGVVNCPQKDCKLEGAFYTFDPATLDSTWCLVVDSLTQLSDSAIKVTMQQQEANLFNTNGGSKAGYDEYGGQGALLVNVLSHMQQAPYHRVFISHAELVEEATGGHKIYPVCGTRALSAKAARYFDHVVYLYRKNNKHQAASGTTFQHNVMCGSRSDVDVAGGASLADMLRGLKPEQAVQQTTAATGARTAASLLAARKG